MNSPTPDDATIEVMDLRLEIAELETERAVLRAQLAVLASHAKAHTEALVIAHGVGFASRNDEVRALKAENDILESAEEAGCTASRNKCMDELAQMLGVDADPLSDEHITGAVDELLWWQDAAKALLAAVLPMLVGLLHDEAITASPRNLATAIDRITAFLEGNK